MVPLNQQSRFTVPALETLDNITPPVTLSSRTGASSRPAPATNLQRELPDCLSEAVIVGCTRFWSTSARARPRMCVVNPISDRTARVLAV